MLAGAVRGACMCVQACASVCKRVHVQMCASMCVRVPVRHPTPRARPSEPRPPSLCTRGSSERKTSARPPGTQSLFNIQTVPGTAENNFLSQTVFLRAISSRLSPLGIKESRFQKGASISVMAASPGRLIRLSGNAAEKFHRWVTDGAAHGHAVCRSHPQDALQSVVSCIFHDVGFFRAPLPSAFRGPHPESEPPHPGLCRPPFPAHTASV